MWRMIQVIRRLWRSFQKTTSCRFVESNVAVSIEMIEISLTTMSSMLGKIVVWEQDL